MKKKIAFLLLRVSIGVVFLKFGIGKFQGDYWTRTIKTMEFFQQLPIDVNTTVWIVGIVEVLTGICLITGLFTKIFSALATIQLISILVLLKFSPIRDVGLLGAALYISLVEEKSFGIDYLLNKKKV